MVPSTQVMTPNIFASISAFVGATKRILVAFAISASNRPSPLVLFRCSLASQVTVAARWNIARRLKASGWFKSIHFSFPVWTAMQVNKGMLVQHIFSLFK